MGLMMSIGVCQWLFLLFSLSTWTLSSSKETRIVCYYTNWSVYRPGDAKFTPQNINPYLCTHLIYAFGGFTKENTLKPFDKYQDIEKGGYAKFTGLKTYNKNLKTMLAIGGWNEGSTRFSPMVANPERRKELVKNAVRFLRQNHFDGLDLDWEYPAFRDGGKSRDRNNYANLVQELREEFERESEKTGRPRLLLTMAVPAGIEYINKGYDVPKLTEYLDWMNILSYDYHSAFEPAVNHHAPLYSLEEDNEYNYDGELNIDYTIKHYLKLGADPTKLVLGIPTYGRSYTLFNPDAYEIGSPADGPGDMGEATRENGYLAYYEICDYVKNQDWEVDQPDPKAMGPYASKDNQWVGYDDEDIVRKKAEYVAANNLGGIMFWAIDNDDFRGKCHGKPYPLIEAGKEALLNAYGLTDDNLISPPTKPIKSRTRTRTKPIKPNSVTEEDKTPSPLVSRRRNRIKQKEKEEPKDTKDVSKTSRRKFRRKSSDEATSTYSSLTVNTPSYTTPAPPATPEMGGAFKCEDEGFFPHPKDCKKYFWCLSGAGDSGIIAHQFTCPAGLYFNKAADSCDYTQNVLCNKKLQKAKSTTSAVTVKDSEASTSTTPVSVFVSTTRPPPKITAATSKTTVKIASSTEAYKEEYEYEDEEEDEDEEDSPNSSKISGKDSEEDPQVIKELIDLIKKAGGLEELERQFKARNYSATAPLNSSGSVDTTTPGSFDKSLYERVLNKALQSSVNNRKRTYTGLRNSRGPQSEGIKDTVEEKTERGKLHYTSITRNRPTTSTTTTTELLATDAQRQRKNFELEYVNIRRNRFGSTTESNERDSTLDRNRILLGEVDVESDDDDDDDEETVEDGEKVKSTFTPQYVNIRRQRPSSTEAASTSKYVEIRRGTTTPADVVNVTTEQESSKYKTIRRGTTTTTTTTASAVEGTTTEGLQSRRGTTVSPSNATDSITESTKSSTTESITSTQSSTRAEPTESTTIPVPSTTQSETTTTTTTTQQPLKVSQFNPKFRLRTKTETVTESTESLRIRGGSRFRNNPEPVQAKTPEEEPSRVPVQSRRRIILTTERYVDESRNYRPSEIADLSSLTAVDFDNLKEFAPSPNHRRRRPTRPSTTTSSTAEQLDDSLKTGSRTSPLARKLVSGTVFGKGRRLEESEAGKVRGYRTTREPSTTQSTLPTSTGRTRKIIRRFRPTTSTTTEENLEENRTEKLFNQKRPQLFPLQENEEIDDSYEDNVNDEEENIKLSESNIRENSEVNSFGTGQKSELHEKSDIFQKGKFGFKTEPEGSSKAPSTEPTNLTRTRKVIRRLSTTTTTSTTESSVHPEGNPNRKRKIIRRLRPVTKLNQIFSTEEKIDESNGTNNETGESTPKRIFRPRFGNVEGTTEADSKVGTSSEEPERQRTRLRAYQKLRGQTTVEKLEENADNTTASNIESTATKSSSRLRLFQKQPTRLEEDQGNANATGSTPPTRGNSRFRSHQRQQEEEKIETEPEIQIVTSPPTKDEATQVNVDEEPYTTEAEDGEDTTTTGFLEETSPSTTSTTEAPTTRNNKFRRPQERPSFTRQRFTQRSESATVSSPRSRTFSRTTSTTESNIPEESSSRRSAYSRYKYRKSTKSPTSTTTPVSSTTEESVVTKRVEDNEVTEGKTTLEGWSYTTGSISTEGGTVTTTEEADLDLEITTESVISTMQDEDVPSTTATVEDTPETTTVPADTSETITPETTVATEIPDASPAAKNILKLPGVRPKFVPGKYKSSVETTTKPPATLSTTKRFGKYLNRFEKQDDEVVEVTQRSTPVPLSKLLYRYGGNQQQDEETTKKPNKPQFTKKPTTKAANSPIFSRTTSTIAPDLDLDTEALKLRNKQLFAQRKPVETTTKPSSDLETTTELLTTLHHVFAAVDDDVKPTTESMSTSKLERLVEVNRIVQVKTQGSILKNHKVEEQRTGEVDPVVNKIGEVSRVTNIKVVNTDGSISNSTDSTENEIKPDESIKSSVDAIIHAAKIEEVPGGGKVNISNILVEINNPFNHREERKFEIYGGSKINYNSPDSIHQNKAEIIDGISHINIITPRPVYYTEASTIALEGLFLTKKPSEENSLFDKNTEEVLETENSRFVNVRILRPDESTRNVVRDNTKVVPIKILKQDDEEVTMKAKVVELRPSTTLEKIKIVPIRVEMTKRVGKDISTAPT